jgi:eukaryotic-like serine/threonine-protein kinase
VMNLDRIGKYRIVGRIGKGAMGEVYKAQDPLLKRFVAIKTIAPALAAEPDFRRRFQREAQSAAALNHPNIVTIFDFGEEDGLVYMAMELLEGRDLRDLVRGGEVRLGQALGIMEQLCDGVGFAHAKGIVHRDLKPGNIHVQPNGQVKILDFGLARLGDSDITRTGTVMGTPHYMSPEQIRGQRADARSDVFSLGAVFYELLSRHRPFEADSAHDVRFQIVERPPDPIHKWAPDAPPVLLALVERALAKDPAARFADAGEMGRALATARDAIENATMTEPGALDADPTIVQAPDATVVQPLGRRPSPGPVHGATALTLARVPADAVQSQPRTFRPDPTVAGGAATEPPAASGVARALLVAGAAAVALTVGIAAGVLWMRGRASAPSTAPAPAGPEQAGIMADVFVTNQVELARADLADRDYDSAARRAEEALKLNPGSADAREVLEQARRRQREIEDAVAQARTAYGSGDVVGASEALGRVMTLAPRHPVVAELSAALKAHFRPQADDARRAAEGARRAAGEAGAGSSTGYRQGGQLASEADALFRGQDFANAAQKYVESRNAFERAKREADEARLAAARPSPSAGPPLSPASAAAPTAAPVPAATARAPVPIPAPTVAAVPAAPPAAAPPPASPATLAPAPRSPSEGAEAAVRRVISEYGRAIETQDLALFRSLKPDLNADEEKRLREAFNAIKSQAVGITVDSVQIEGDRATVKVTRQDVVNGRPMRPAPQTFRLARSGGAWLIQSIGQ